MAVAKSRKSRGLDPAPETHIGIIQRERERDGTGAEICYITGLT